MGQRLHKAPQRHAGASDGSDASDALCLLSMTVDTGSATAVRQVAARLCGAALQLARIESCGDSRHSRVCLCVAAPLAEQVSAALARHFPDAVLGAKAQQALRRAG